MSTKSILVVHEDKHVARLLCKLINNSNYEYHVASSFSEVEGCMEQHELQFILTDINIDGVSKNEYISFLKSQKEHILVVSSMDQETIRKQAMKLGAEQFINLPVSLRELQDTLSPFL